jgi:hypothetical protein
MKIITAGQIFFFRITSCQGLRNKQVNLYEFFLFPLEHSKFKLKLEL